LRVKAGEFEYDDLVSHAEGLVAELEPIYRVSSLPDIPDVAAIEQLHAELRMQVYCA
jgi:hypothetical protein